MLNDSSRITDYFDNDEIVLYKDEADFVNKVVYYLDAENERNAIAARAYKTLSETFSYAVISTQILKLIELRL